jgi:hypothetical protein
MIGTKRVRWIILLLCLAALFLVTEVILPTLAPAQEEVASYIRRYKDREVSTGFYEQYEVKPTAAKVRTRTRLADSHWGIRFYQRRRCEDCHIRETRDIHTTRANITCRQCHGGEPIASLGHYYSPFNPIRKHAYVCAKCHEGANASYASYLVHTPNPALAATQKTFPLLFYVFWFMIVLAGGTFAVFLPHTALWGIRELFMKKEKAEGERED